MAVTNTTPPMFQNMAVLAERSRRKPRRPQHPFNLVFKPFQIQPFLIAPVLPGESMENALIQARFVTDPVRSKLTGWWCGLWLFYVKIRDLEDRDLLETMFLDMNADLSSLNSAAAAWAYHAGGTINWVEECLKRVVVEYFRFEGEAYDIATIDNVPLASIRNMDVFDSLSLEADLDSLDFDVDTDTSGTIEASEIETAMYQWQWMRQNNLIRDMDFEDYLASYGVRPKVEEAHIPELLRYIEDWSYPTNTVEPTTGAPSSAVAWSIAERADKRRFFREPGFVFGVTCCRPKVYRQSQTGSFTGLMTSVKSWLPAMLTNSPEVSRIASDFGSGPVPELGSTIVGGYNVDIRDLLIHGEQFVNRALVVDSSDSTLTLPADGATLNKRYPAEAEVDDLFVDTTGALEHIRADGIVSLNIMSQQVDVSPAN